MTLKEFIASNPGRKEIAFQICAVANGNVLEVDETYVWEPLSKLGKLTKADFYDNVQETFDKYGAEALTHYGIVNWKLVEEDERTKRQRM